MRRSLLICYSLLLILSINLLVWIIPKYTPEWLGYGISSSALPNILATVLLFFSGGLLFKTWRDKSDCSLPPIGVYEFIHLVKNGVVLLATFPLIKLIGFIPASILSLLALQYIAGQRKIVTMIIVAICVSIVAYGLLVHLLQVPLP